MTASTSRSRRRITDRLVMDVASSLTDRDREILRLLRWHRVLTTSQVHVMVFADRNTAQHRMTRLHEFYSANLADEIKKGLCEKANQGGFPHGAPSAM